VLGPEAGRFRGVSAAPGRDPREALVRAYRWLRQHGLNDSHSGNASARDGDMAWITPTGCCGDTLSAEQLIACPLDAAPPPDASVDAALHLAVYRASSATHAVLHSHGPHSIAMTLGGGDFAPGDFEGQYYFSRVPVLDIPPADYLARSPAAVASALAVQRVCIVRGHGVYAAGETIELAYKWSCSLESSARIAWLARVARIPPGAGA
jgi:L-fuculose-phosphate aldolase